MTTTKANEFVEGLEETKTHRDARIRHLWEQLCPSGICDLDVKGLQRGFRKIDHREPCPLRIPLQAFECFLMLFHSFEKCRQPSQQDYGRSGSEWRRKDPI